MSKFLTLTLLLIAIAAAFLHYHVRIALPPSVLHHRAVYVPQLLSEETGAELRRLTKQFGEFPTNAADLKFYQTLHEHIGEAQPIGVDGRCSHSFLVPSINKTHCVLPGRIDVARHFVLGGGVEGKKELFNLAASRLQSFGRYMFNVSEFDVIAELFSSETFQEAARTVCPESQSYLDPFQFNFILQVPGQTVALHLDAPYFWGATRFEFPQWLLAVMVFSGLFEDQFVHQVQLVGYYHSWNNTEFRDGDFVYWNENIEVPKRIPAYTLSGSSVDGSKTVHAAGIYFPERKPPMMEKSAENLLKYVGDDNWHVLSNGRVVGRYSTDDLRMTIVYRARCFRDADQAEEFKKAPPMSLDYIREKLNSDLKSRGILSEQEAKDILPLDWAMLLLDTYAKYPLPPRTLALLPYNYCALPQLFPWTEQFVSLFCDQAEPIV